MQLSIVTITYNDSEGLKKTLQSLETLPYSSFEHVIVDSSPAVNQTVLESLPKSWPLSYHTTPARGIYAAMNEGISKAKGEYVWFLNSGDRLKNADTLLKNMKENLNSDLIIFGADLMKAGKFQYSQYPLFQNLKDNLLGFNRICHQAVLFKKSVFDTTGFFDTSYSLASDYAHLLKCQAKNLKAVFVKEILVEYDMGGQSGNFKKVFDQIKEIQKNASINARDLYLHHFVRSMEYARIKTLKIFSQSRFSSLLKPLWLTYKRSRS